MNITDNTNAVQLKKLGPLTRAAGGLSIDAAPTDPDTDGRRQYSPNYGDAFANRGGSFAPAGPGNGPDSTALNPAAQGIAAPIQTGAAPVRPGSERGIAQLPQSEHISTAIGAVDQGAAGIGKHQVAQTVGIAGNLPTGRNENGIITADSAQAAMGNGMQRSGGIAGSIDMKGVNEIMARENKARGEMIDGMIAANGGNGIAALPENRDTAEWNAAFDQRRMVEGFQDAMKRAGTRTERAALGQALNQTIAGQNQLAHEAMRLQGDLNNKGIAASIEKARQASIDQRAADRNQIQVRGQDVTADTAAGRIASQERIAEQRRDAGARLTLPQTRINSEIDAARERVTGLSPEEIKRKTANYTATGRENPDFDPTLAKAVSLANRRKYGADDHFDQREQAQQPAGTDGDVMTRFRGDQAMQGHKVGQQTDQGLEVFDASGKLIGHYR